MLSTGRVMVLFEDARRLEVSALERLTSGDVRDAADKAWGATKRAADALVLARTGEEPSTSGRTARGVRELRRSDPTLFADLHQRYFARQAELHGNCFYDGNCEPLEVIEAQVRETDQFIRDCKTRAETG